ncbi:MAG: hypothetical protein JW863_18225 [Chitinispirillaceae bacterium]|nr:hypothetical protein [Chitinispirillaceae bacterium]
MKMVIFHGKFNTRTAVRNKNRLPEKGARRVTPDLPVRTANGLYGSTTGFNKLCAGVTTAPYIALSSSSAFFIFYL